MVLRDHPGVARDAVATPWSWLYPLYLVAATRPTSSIFCYARLSIIPWWPFPEVGERVTTRRGRVTLFCLVLAFGVLVQVAWVRWFYVVGPAAIDFP